MKVKTQINNARLRDNPIENPWVINTEKEINYLTTLEFKNDPVLKSWMGAVFELSPSKTIRSRAVYNVVDMITAVSGLADVLIVFTSTIMTFFFTISFLKSSLAHQIGLV